jgi:hypothetical protein
LNVTVAGHYKRDRASFDETARQWAIQYAGAPGNGDKIADSAKVGQTKAEQAGLAQKDVDKFVNLGFDEASVSIEVRPIKILSITLEEQVIRVLSNLSYRGKNVDSISDNAVSRVAIRVIGQLPDQTS